MIISETFFHLDQSAESTTLIKNTFMGLAKEINTVDDVQRFLDIQETFRPEVNAGLEDCCILIMSLEQLKTINCTSGDSVLMYTRSQITGNHWIMIAREILEQFYNPRYTVIVGDFIIDTDFEYEYSDYEPTEYRVIGSTANFQLLEVFTDELSDGFCMNNGKPAIAFNYDQRQYLYIRTETIRERNDTFSTDDIYAGSRRSDIRRGSR